MATSRLSSLPLSGIRILDMTRVLAGPFCTMLLADLGAEVVKVERPGCGDDTRSWGPPFVGGESSYFFSVNRNKKSIAVDFKQDRGAQIIKQLASESDVLIENYVPGKLSEYGLDYTTLSCQHPKLVYCSLTGFGSSGPYAQRLGYDVIAAGMGGLMAQTGPENGEPIKVGVAMTDMATGLYAHGAILAALRHRDVTGQGQLVECSLYHTQVACMIHAVTQFLNGGVMPKRMGTAHTSIVPYQAFETADGYVLVGAGNNGQFADLCARLDLSHLAEDERYTSNMKRVDNRDQLLAELSRRFLQLSTAEWLEKFDGAPMPYGPIQDIEQVINDPHTKHQNMIQEIEHPTAGQISMQGPAVHYSGFEQTINRAPPLLGQHNAAVLRDWLEMSDPDIESLVSDGVLGTSV
ncbi:succinate--hydroxymethylglutarate CoA-transferase-like [Sycon ciliatum]|uniref:succinate--hydroxymethylglutarate CoA-transferase-like n=1 Tax=Sycon ciliatum TaxID=27933 RepID=UPI0020A8C5BB|eukprot:scpid83279/ scgid19021/ CaiB/baiF CoA-transferase family protein C7orf10; Dermal papilla-derived protein 13